MEGSMLGHYRLQTRLGRGASGQVYSALDMHTGSTVAIKSVPISTLPKSALPELMSEIDLLKNLSHKNIVGYEGFFKDEKNLYIILEYCESGSLQQMMKAGGKGGVLSEQLTRVFVRQVLEGLIYLHDQGVIHRDIKGANVLIVKDGTIKLADFGVSARTGVGQVQDDHAVVGSPYWMAPEVIVQTGATTASDIWSLGSLIVELLTGKPPYGSLQPMQALWRIVQDEQMQLPKGATPLAIRFLEECFRKDPGLRGTAKRLVAHPWLQADDADKVGYEEALSMIRVWNGAVNASPAKNGTLRRPRTSAAADRILGGITLQRTAAGSGLKNALNVASRPVITEDDEDVDRGSPPARKSFPSLKLAPSKPAEALLRQREQSAIKERVEDWDSDFGSDASVKLGHARSSEWKRNVSVEGRTRKISDEQKTISLSQPTRERKISNGQRAREAEEIRQRKISDPNQATIRPAKQIRAPTLPFPNRNEEHFRTIRPATSPTSAPGVSGRISLQNVSASKPSINARAKTVSEDWSDMAEGSNDDFAARLVKMKGVSRKAILHPDDLRRKYRSLSQTQRMMPPPVPKRTLTDESRPKAFAPLLQSPQGKSPPAVVRRVSGSILLPSPSSVLRVGPGGAANTPVPGRSPPASRQNSGRSTPQLTDSQRELFQRHGETDEEDYEDFLGAVGEIASDGRRHLRLPRTRQVYDYVSFEDVPALTSEDEEIRLKNEANMLSRVTKAVTFLQPKATDQEVEAATDDLYAVFEEAVAGDFGEDKLRRAFLAAHGFLAILEVLETTSSDHAVLKILLFLNRICIRPHRSPDADEPGEEVDALVEVDLESVESFCLIGGIQAVCRHLSRRDSVEVRSQAIIFIRALLMLGSTTTMFISCRGVRDLIALVGETDPEQPILVIAAVEAIHAVLQYSFAVPRDDFCRLLVREGIVRPLTSALVLVCQHTSGIGEERQNTAFHLLLLICQAVQSDTRMQDAFASRTVLRGLLSICLDLGRRNLSILVKCIRHLSTNTGLIEMLHQAGAIGELTQLLQKHLSERSANDICFQIFQTLFAMTRLSKTRQTEAAAKGIVPLLKQVIMKKSSLDQFALPILFDISSAGLQARTALKEHDGIDLIISSTSNVSWRLQAVEAVLAWSIAEPSTMDEVFSRTSASEKLAKCFLEPFEASLAASKSVPYEVLAAPFEQIIEPFTSIMRSSSVLVTAIANPAFIDALTEALQRPYSAATRKALLRLTGILAAVPETAPILIRSDIPRIVQGMSTRDEGILVRRAAQTILPDLAPHVRPASRTSEPIKPRIRRPQSILIATTSSENTSHGAISPEKVERPRPRQMISRSNIRDTRWLTDENGKLRSVVDLSSPSKALSREPGS